MFNKFQSEELVKYLGELVNEQSDRIQPYYQILDKKSEKPYVMHEKTNQITVILRGKGIAIIDDQKIELKKNDILLLSTKTKHSFVSQDEELELFHIHIPAGEVENDRYILKENCME